MDAEWHACRPCSEVARLREATMVIPERLCDEHWCRWWGSFDPSGRMYREAKFGLWADRVVAPLRTVAWWTFELMELMFGRKA